MLELRGSDVMCELDEYFEEKTENFGLLEQSKIQMNRVEGALHDVDYFALMIRGGGNISDH